MGHDETITGNEQAGDVSLMKGRMSIRPLKASHTFNGGGNVVIKQIPT